MKRREFCKAAAAGASLVALAGYLPESRAQSGSASRDRVRMDVGIVTWTLGMTEPEAVARKAVSLGLDGVQYAGDYRDCSGSALRKALDAAGLRLFAVDPFNAGPPDPEKATQAAAIAYYRRVVDFAADAGGAPVTLQGLSQWTRNCPDRESAMARLLACCEAVDHYAQQRGVTTLYEACNHYEVPLMHTAADCQALIQQVGGDNMRLVLDSFHMNINEADPLRVLRDHGAMTEIYHISDSGRGGIGSGHIDFRAQYEALVESGFRGSVAVEPVLPALTPSNPPRTAAERQALDAEIARSVAAWRRFMAA
ncbi:sugar phosphate isomerase/epimerase family protein [Salinicola rhizosphaerae]|uniref:Xylose isomerase-like TIM barrel domain-containing protein n=1 Tax=Salinicola rhizosphaerae TaxID=1443141 RepID=A0ABQ3DR77_9GAMM|nr:sugar phosphate isomerase/epimerase family protein [Salinicola rhizosphaerae]GHB07806.1 hypothetical protein GCM10009038_01300 [Salinicola rhizosphaerae]